MPYSWTEEASRYSSSFTGSLTMKIRYLAIAVTAASLAFSVVPAEAKGCLKGAAVGGAAGHVAGHHGLVGAGVGCLVGRHRANKADARQAAQQSGNTGTDSRT